MVYRSPVTAFAKKGRMLGMQDTSQLRARIDSAGMILTPGGPDRVAVYFFLSDRMF